MDYLRCQICGEKLSFNPYCPCSLGEHLIKKHPELRVTHFSCENTANCCTRDRKTDTQNTFQGCSKAKMGKCPSKSAKPNGSGIFKTTVETWRQGPLKVKCPVCNQTDLPCIRKQRNKVAYSSFGALCMLSCWPLCFLPFLMPEGGSNVHLFCKHCGTYLGEYNRKTGALRTCCTDNDKKAKIPSNMC